MVRWCYHLSLWCVLLTTVWSWSPSVAAKVGLSSSDQPMISWRGGYPRAGLLLCLEWPVSHLLRLDTPRVVQVSQCLVREKKGVRPCPTGRPSYLLYLLKACFLCLASFIQGWPAEACQRALMCKSW